MKREKSGIVAGEFIKMQQWVHSTFVRVVSANICELLTRYLNSTAILCLVGYLKEVMEIKVYFYMICNIYFLEEFKKNYKDYF